MIDSHAPYFSTAAPGGPVAVMSQGQAAQPQLTAQVPAPIQPPPQNQPGSAMCRVCGDEASGFHYGVDSCEGCKGFFRRCITQGINFRCTNEVRCQITPFTRNSCQYCRLKKCFEVGMSREASRLGRRPKRCPPKPAPAAPAYSGPMPEPGGRPLNLARQSSAPYEYGGMNYPSPPGYHSPGSSANACSLSPYSQSTYSPPGSNSSAGSNHMPPSSGAGSPGVMAHGGGGSSNSSSEVDLDKWRKRQLEVMSRYMQPSKSAAAPPASTMSQQQQQTPPPPPLQQQASAHPVNTAVVRPIKYEGDMQHHSMNDHMKPGYHPSMGFGGDMIPQHQFPQPQDMGVGGFNSFPHLQGQQMLHHSQQMQSPPLPMMDQKTRPHSDLSDFQADMENLGIESSQDSPPVHVKTEVYESSEMRLDADVKKFIEYAGESRTTERMDLLETVTDGVIKAHRTHCYHQKFRVDEADQILREKAKAGIDTRPEGGIWYHFLNEIAFAIERVVKFFKDLPGFVELELKDQICLIKQGTFSVMMSQMMYMVNPYEGTIIDPQLKFRFSKSDLSGMPAPMQYLFEDFFKVASHYWELKLSDEEIGLLNGLIAINSGRQGVKDKHAVQKLEVIFSQALCDYVRRNHPEDPGRYMKILKLYPVLEMSSQVHSESLHHVKVSKDTATRFPELHHEVFSE